MTTISNLHTHSLFCDGRNTIDEMIQAAIRAGFISLGFSGHCPTGFLSDDCQITDIDGYFNELENARRRYAGTITIFKGLELESRISGGKRPVIDPRCDYTIGSDHLFWTQEGPYSVDYTPEEWNKALKATGSVEKLMECYFEELCSFAEEVPFDIIGHVDLYTKFNEGGKLFDDTLPKYKTLTLHYIDRLARTGKIFEVNTGAIGKGYRDTPYPSPFILKRLHELKVPVIISSDSHSISTINCHFDEAERLLKEVGFTTQMRLTENGFISVPL
ncbi:MAG: histidinol-phosphatase HisJ family protein [Spirochaetales bacterium]|nr:histidinol-phosphatase HisJ family protein [Spirochaetales bacterium]